MKIVNNCTILAAVLSAKYRSYGDFKPLTTANNADAADSEELTSNSLESFLDENGILLTMCMRFHGIIPWLECSQPPRSNGSDQQTVGNEKVSASWIQANKTGFRVVHSPVDVGPPVGLILKPTAFTIQCLYPIDAATDGRDDNGCGPLSKDNRYGSKGYDHTSSWSMKFLMRQEIIHFKNSIFGSNRTWESIPCDEFAFGLNLTETSTFAHIATMNDTSSSTFRNNQKNKIANYSSWEYQTLSAFVIDQWSHVMRHSVCNQNLGPPSPPPSFNETQCLIYTGPFSWHPREWSEMIHVMDNSIVEHPFIGTWNEVVLQKKVTPATKTTTMTTTTTATTTHPIEPEAVQAVFYIQTGIKDQDELAHQIAQKQAKSLRKPLFYVVLDDANYTAAHGDEGRGGDLFHCVSQQPPPNSYLRHVPKNERREKREFSRT